MCIVMLLKDITILVHFILIVTQLLIKIWVFLVNLKYNYNCSSLYPLLTLKYMILLLKILSSY